jgi:hypothetical protein
MERFRGCRGAWQPALRDGDRRVEREERKRREYSDRWDISTMREIEGR